MSVRTIDSPYGSFRHHHPTRLCHFIRPHSIIHVTSQPNHLSPTSLVVAREHLRKSFHRGLSRQASDQPNLTARPVSIVMDSMRSLNVSLPNPPPKQTLSRPPEELLQSFRAAALSVTNLYKTAASDQARARRSGYQDALDDLLVFLDKQNLGLDDGEGWKVRQWATERLDGSPQLQGGSDSDDERGETEKRARSTSPVIPRKASPELAATQNISERSTSPVRPTIARPTPPLFSVSQPATIVEKPETFTFRSSYPYPNDIDMQTVDPTPSDIPQPESLPQVQASSSTPAVRVEVVPRPSRSALRNSVHSNRHITRSTRSLGSGAGSKRRVTFGDFFDIGTLGDGKDSAGGGGKRARHG